MFEFYKEDIIDGEERIVLSFPEKIAPIKFAILPLLKKNLSSFAQDILDLENRVIHASMTKRGLLEKGIDDRTRLELLIVLLLILIH